MEYEGNRHSEGDQHNGFRLEHALNNGGASRREKVQQEVSGPVWAGTSGEQVAKEAQQLVEQAHLAIHEGRVDDGERLFRKSLEYAEFPAVINNLALLQLVRHNQPEAALRLLQRNLEKPVGPHQPFTQALATRCFVRLNRREEARRSLEQAIQDFETGLSSLANRTREERHAWQEYTTEIMEAASELGDDRRVWQLYERWAPYHGLSSSHFYGGIAAFNLKRFRSARAAWRRARKDRRRSLRAYETVAMWCDRELVEPFTLDYDFAGPDSPAHMLIYLAGMDGGAGRHDPDAFNYALIDFLRRPANRLFMLWTTFRPFLPSDLPGGGGEAALEGVRCFIAAGGDWSEALAKRMFLSPSLDSEVKVAALEYQEMV